MNVIDGRPVIDFVTCHSEGDDISRKVVQHVREKFQISTVGWGPGLGRGTGAAVLARGSRPRASGGGTKWSRPLTKDFYK